MKSFEELDAKVRSYPKARVAVANATDAAVLEAVVRADANGLADAILVGRADDIRRTAEEGGVDISIADVVDVPDELAAAAKAVELVKSGDCGILMKGYIHTDDFLRALLDRDKGLRAGALMSHVFIGEVAGFDRLVLISDGAMNIAPDLEGKAAIAMNAVFVARAFGIEAPRVAVLAATEVVNPKMPATTDAAILHKMSERGQFVPPVAIEGPLALDNAVNEAAARHKRITGEVAGRADIIICPNIETGNALAKALVYFAGARLAGILVGAAAPVVLTSRSDSADSKYFSIAAAVLVSQVERHLKLKVGKVRF